MYKINWNKGFKGHVCCGSRAHLDQSCCRPEAHLGHGLTLASAWDAVQAWAWAGEGAQGRSAGGDGSLRHTVAIYFLDHAKRTSSCQWVHNLNKKVHHKKKNRGTGAHTIPVMTPGSVPSACHAEMRVRIEAEGFPCWSGRCCPGWAAPSHGSPVVSACRSACCSVAGSSSAISAWRRRPYWPRTSPPYPWERSTQPVQPELTHPEITCPPWLSCISLCANMFLHNNWTLQW